ncbi:hypothetical protein GUJ93_ZPchr0005g15060 [Zizania palustris]|uniref:Uncharacterized protein n=1 Tax=Zizania palustris TaxID=103762 RepID=A0A8J5T5U8_ZIZPA|nr:hypothetical protein GUJ93_ZPchr0005g15060 [Zizania palustris]
MSSSCWSSVLAIFGVGAAADDSPAGEAAAEAAPLRRRLLAGETAAASDREVEGHLAEEVRALERAVAAAVPIDIKNTSEQFKAETIVCAA